MIDQDSARCEHCERVVEVCGFCGERCGNEICYRCCLVDLGETLEHPHPHGG